MTKIILVGYWEIESVQREGQDWRTTSGYKSTFESYKYVHYVNSDGSMCLYMSKLNFICKYVPCVSYLKVVSSLS